MTSPPMLSLDPADPAEYRQALARFASGVIIVTAEGGGEPVGMTCQSFSSLSLAPPLVLFAAGNTSTSFPRLQRIGHVCINVLAHDQAELSTQFARTGTDKWAGVAWSPGLRGAPRIHEVELWCEGVVDAVHPGGDHSIVVVRVERLTLPHAPRSPLIFHAGRYARLPDEVADLGDTPRTEK